MSMVTLDAKGLKCQLPVLHAKKAMREVPVGATLRVLATDPGAIEDFKSFCQTTGNVLVDWSQEGSVITLNIQKIR